jgi:hypothetical protein
MNLKEYELTDLTTQTSQPFKEYEQFGEENRQHTHLQLTPNLVAQHNPYIHISNIILENKSYIKMHKFKKNHKQSSVKMVDYFKTPSMGIWIHS